MTLAAELLGVPSVSQGFTAKVEAASKSHFAWNCVCIDMAVCNAQSGLGLRP